VHDEVLLKWLKFVNSEDEKNAPYRLPFDILWKEWMVCYGAATAVDICSDAFVLKRDEFVNIETRLVMGELRGETGLCGGCDKRLCLQPWFRGQVDRHEMSTEAETLGEQKGKLVAGFMCTDPVCQEIITPELAAPRWRGTVFACHTAAVPLRHPCNPYSFPKNPCKSCLVEADKVCCTLPSHRVCLPHSQFILYVPFVNMLFVPEYVALGYPPDANRMQDSSATGETTQRSRGLVSGCEPGLGRDLCQAARHCAWV